MDAKVRIEHHHRGSRGHLIQHDWRFSGFISHKASLRLSTIGYSLTSSWLAQSFLDTDTWKSWTWSIMTPKPCVSFVPHGLGSYSLAMAESDPEVVLLGKPTAVDSPFLLGVRKFNLL